MSNTHILVWENYLQRTEMKQRKSKYAKTIVFVMRRVFLSNWQKLNNWQKSKKGKGGSKFNPLGPPHRYW